jgi:HK97 family phage portal protein
VPSILRSIFGNGSTTNYDAGPWGGGMVRWGSGGASSVGNEDAMRLSAVFACMRLLSEAIATMPLDTYVRGQGIRKPFRPRPAYLDFQPPHGSRIDYLSQVMLSLLTDGNAFVATPRDGLGDPLSLVVIDPGAVQVERDTGGRDSYIVGGQRYDDYDVLHIKGMTMPGALRGLSPLAYARETADLGLQAQRFGANFFANGALPSAVIEAPGEYPRSAAERLAALWDARHRGPDNSGRIGVLTNGAKLTKVTIAPEEAQFLQTRQFQVPDIARFFGVPPHLIADASNSTSWGSGLAEQNLAFGQMSLRPWVERIEDAHARLLTTHGLPDVFVKLNMDALLRAGTKERYEAHQIGLSAEFLTVDEVRRIEDLPPLPKTPPLPTPPPVVPAPPVPPTPPTAPKQEGT